MTWNLKLEMGIPNIPISRYFTTSRTLSKALMIAKTLENNAVIKNVLQSDHSHNDYRPTVGYAICICRNVIKKLLRIFLY